MGTSVLKGSLGNLLCPEESGAKRPSLRVEEMRQGYTFLQVGKHLVCVLGCLSWKLVNNRSMELGVQAEASLIRLTCIISFCRTHEAKFEGKKISKFGEGGWFEQKQAAML